MTLFPKTRQDVSPMLTLSGAVLEAQWDRVGHITLSDRCRRPMGREKKKNPKCLILGLAPYWTYPTLVHGLMRNQVTDEPGIHPGTVSKTVCRRVLRRIQQH